MASSIADTILIDRSDKSRLYSKVTWRLIPFLFICYMAAYLDRVNVGFAKLQMLADLHFSETIYGLGAGIFFIGYFIFEVPSNIMLHRVGARWWIARIMFTWAILSGAMMFVTTPWAFYTIRFLLGAAEAGLFPGVILYLTYWYPAERRGKIIALFMTGIPMAGVIGGPLSGWIMQMMGGIHGLAAWQWLFLIEAMPSLVLSVCVLLYLDNGIESARWLSPSEKEMLKQNIALDAKQVESSSSREGFTNPRVWLLCAAYFCIIMGLYGVGFWLPTLIKGAGVTSALSIGLLTVLPYGAATLGMVSIGISSDATRERRWHLAIPGFVGALAWLATAHYSHDATLAVTALTVVTICVMSTLSQFWCIPTAILTGAAAAVGIAVINSVGNLAGFVSPYLIGWIIDTTKSTDLGVFTLAISIALGSLLILLMPKKLVNR
jgi:sugar phosphate permease